MPLLLVRRFSNTGSRHGSYCPDGPANECASIHGAHRHDGPVVHTRLADQPTGDRMKERPVHDDLTKGPRLAGLEIDDRRIEIA